jgi:hypothetical protein
MESRPRDPTIRFIGCLGGRLISLMPTPTSPDSTLEGPDPVQPVVQQHSLRHDCVPEDDPADLDRELLEKLELSILRQKGSVCSQPRESPPLLDHKITPQIFSESVFYPAAGLDIEPLLRLSNLASVLLWGLLGDHHLLILIVRCL